MLARQATSPPLFTLAILQIRLMLLPSIPLLWTPLSSQGYRHEPLCLAPKTIGLFPKLFIISFDKQM